jgi:hypothetical protein
MLLPRKLLGLIYVAIGVFVAYSKDYLENVETLKRALSAVLAILLWPLLLLGIDLRVT